ncbi:MAG: hypothetical protein FJ221_16595 [Lentisphaerae bacterium]|nr:hypothetical protein [Lentisphaerota bacterium]
MNGWTESSGRSAAGRAGPGHLASRSAGSIALLGALLFSAAAGAEELRVPLGPAQVSAGAGDAAGLVDEQDRIIGPPVGAPAHGWTIPSTQWKQFPFSADLDLGGVRPVSKLWLFDTEGTGGVVIAQGGPDAWTPVATNACTQYRRWVAVPLDVETRHLRLTRLSPGANFSEIAVYEYPPAEWAAVKARKAEEARAAAERAAALERAAAEMAKRPLVDLGAPFGRLPLVDEIDCAATAPDRGFGESPAGAGRVETILGRACRVLPPAEKESTWMGWRIGRMKLLQPGAAYVLEVEYPEDAPRSMVVINTGNETSRGFHTGPTTGDAFHPKYVDNRNESLDVPLSGRWERWTLLFRLHDRFPERGLIRGAGPRTLTPEDGFDVTIAQFDARNVPMSRGAAVARIRLFAVPDPEALAQPLRLPPAGLPHRRLFWREEMADGVIAGAKEVDRGLRDRLDWYLAKAGLMRFLGMNTFSKDLLEFGACQHWDPTPLGGNEWVYHEAATKGLWAEIVALMGGHGFDVLPYYEYSGSKGAKGLGPQRRAKPLARDDAFTHISWIESANADVTDPDAIEDFGKMLDLTVLALKDKARFAGAWLRPRSQLPVGFGDATRARFAREAHGGAAVTREQLKADRALYGRYLRWWEGKRRDFLTAARDRLRAGGVADACILFTGCAGEPGVGFDSWEPVLVTDSPAAWTPVLAQPGHRTAKDEAIRPVTVDEVVRGGLYLKGLLAPGLNWGDWEVHHANPSDDPAAYRDLDGVMLTHAFNRLHTVASPATFDAYRARGGLAAIRHYTLNENMMFDAADKEKLGYFVADIERAGPYCMMAEVQAVAAGDPTMIGYLSGGNFGRGFPEPVRRFNAAFLALPALPSRVVEGACDAPGVVVRRIDTPSNGTWFAVAHTGWKTVEATIRLPGDGPVADAVTGAEVAAGRTVRCTLGPCELRAWQGR